MSGAIDAFRRDIQLSFLHRSVVAVRFRDEQRRRAQQITGRLAALLIDSIEPRNNEFHLASLSSATKGAEKLVVSGEVRVSGPTFEVAAGSITLDRGMVLENVDLKQVAAVLQDGERSSELLEAASLPEHPLERPRGMPSIFGALGGLAIFVVGSGVAWRRSRHRRTGDAEADR